MAASEPPAEILSERSESKDLARSLFLNICAKRISNQDFAGRFFATVDSRDFAEGMGEGEGPQSQTRRVRQEFLV